MYKILEEDGIEIEAIEDHFSVGFDEQATTELNLDSSEPVLIREREYYSTQGDIVEYSIGYYNSKFKKYSISLKD
ncbi:UTRA domain-containing protein [Staphylococcus succinus]|uniref:UTRA domain-containing protein n=1 Tax=Staphylococcus succinus TaxID=61015 RepID=UPI002174DF01|nr:UTRA domain-containing protein [Staphylococcus succinus]